MATEGPAGLFRRGSARLAALPGPALFLLVFAAVSLSHSTLLRLPYFWDEGGYYVPAALDFYRSGTLIPEFTNAHPPLPNVVLGSLWHLVGLHIVATRLCAAAFAAAGLTAVFRLGQRLLRPAAGLTVAVLTAVYPIWFAQSTLAHADIFAAAFTLWAFALYLAPERSGTRSMQPPWRKPVAVAALFSLAAMSKETAILQPAALACVELWLLVRDRRTPALRRAHGAWLAAMAFPLLPLLAWYGYHRHRTGFTFGNPEYLRYNATANFNALHISNALRYRFVHLFWQRDIWLPIVFAAACLFLPRRGASLSDKDPEAFLPRTVLRAVGVLVMANWLAFSLLGGALLTRYLLPVYPLILLVCVALWRSRTPWWPGFAAVTAAAFLSALWINPPTYFAPEDNLTYRDMIVVQQGAIDFVASHYPSATVLTAWPVAADIFRPELGYVARPMKATSIDNFTLAEVEKAALEPERYDTAIVFSSRFIEPGYARYLQVHPATRAGRDYAANRELSPAEIAFRLHGRVVWQEERDGEWAAVLRFDRSYEARLDDLP